MIGASIRQDGDPGRALYSWPRPAPRDSRTAGLPAWPAKATPAPPAAASGLRLARPAPAPPFPAPKGCLRPVWPPLAFTGPSAPCARSRDRSPAADFRWRSLKKSPVGRWQLYAFRARRASFWSRPLQYRFFAFHLNRSRNKVGEDSQEY